MGLSKNTHAKWLGHEGTIHPGKEENYYLNDYIQHLLGVWHFIETISLCLPHPPKNKYHFISMFRKREWRHSKGKHVARGHTARNHQSWNGDPALSPEPVLGNQQP